MENTTKESNNGNVVTEDDVTAFIASISSEEH